MIITATEARFLPKTPTQNRSRGGLLTNADSARPHHRRHHGFVCISCYQSRHRQNFNFFPHRTNGTLTQSRMTGIGFCIGSRSRQIIALTIPDDGGNTHLRNVGQFLPDYTAQYPRRQSSLRTDSSCTLYN
jgi:hypothetical protein